MPEKHSKHDVPPSDNAPTDNAMKQICQAWPAEQWADVHVVLAVSGGADSMALLRAMLAIKGEFGGAGKLHGVHINHQLRQEESGADARWIAEQCRTLGVPITVCRANVQQLADDRRDGLESAAREERYRLLTHEAEQLGARYVATGHTWDDQAETVLFRLLRGSGLRGLSGMRQSRPLGESVTLVRPLLGCRRQDLLAYLQSLDQSFREDLSNKDIRFTRNRIRQELLPRLRSDYNAQIDAALVRLAEQASSTQQYVESQAEALLSRCSLENYASESNESARGQRVLAFDATPLAGEPELLVREALRLAWRRARLSEQAMTHRWWHELAVLALCPEASPALNLPGNIRAEISKKRLTLSRTATC